MSLATPNGAMTTAIRELQETQRKQNPSRSAGLLTSRTTRGVTRQPLPQTQRSDKNYPVPVKFTGFAPGGFLICQTFSVGDAAAAEAVGQLPGSLVLHEDYYAVEPPPAFLEWRAYSLAMTTTDDDLAGAAGAVSGRPDPVPDPTVQMPDDPRQLVVHLEQQDLAGQLNWHKRVVVWLQRREKASTFFTGTVNRLRRMVEWWWPQYGATTLWITRTGQGSTIDLAGTPWAGKSVKTGWLDMNVNGSRWTPHRHLADAERVRFPSQRLGVTNIENVGVLVKTQDSPDTPVPLRVDVEAATLEIYDVEQEDIPETT